MNTTAGRFIAVVVLLWSLVTGCSSTGTSKDVAALDRAYKAGVLTQSEYDAKKAALKSQMAAVAALEQALASGALTKDEYQVAKARLVARKPDPLAAAQSQPAANAATPATTPTMTPPPAHRAADATQPRVISTEPRAAAGGNDHLLRMKIVRAIDQQGFERPMPSASMLVPIDWQSQGGTAWNVKDSCNSIQTTLRASGPDGRAIEIFPTYNWNWADDPRPLQMAAAQRAQTGARGCEVLPLMSASDFLRRNVRRYRPNAQLVGIEPAPRLMAMLQKQARQTEQAARQYRLQQRVRPDVVRGRLRYNLNGQPVEEWLFVATIIVGTLGPSYNTQTMQMTQAYTYNCVAYATAERTPQGRLDGSEKFFELIAGTYRVDPAWQAKVTGHAQAMQQIELKGIRDRSDIVRKNADDIAKIRRQSNDYAQQSADRRSEQWSQSMRDVETYRNPSTGETVELSNQYGQAWVNNRGEYLLSDQPGFNPSVTLKEDWKPLVRVQK